MINVRYAIDNETVVAWETPDGFRASALATNQEVLDYLASGGQIAPYEPPTIDPKEQAKVELAASDKEMARIAEDLINVLIAKGLMTFDDLPKPVIDKLENRANLRKVLQADDD